MALTIIRGYPPETGEQDPVKESKKFLDLKELLQDNNYVAGSPAGRTTGPHISARCRGYATPHVGDHLPAHLVPLFPGLHSGNDLGSGNQGSTGICVAYHPTSAASKWTRVDGL